MERVEGEKVPIIQQQWTNCKESNRTFPFSMAKPDENAEKETWGTWEELLLACAVNRYGTKSWDSVAVEIQKRSSKTAPFLTPLNCKQKFHDLKRRYTPKPDNHENDVVGDDKTENETIPWLDELRKLRVAELKRELERYDLSIVSLQLKVKRLKEEREESLRECENGEDKLDLEKSEEKREIDTEPEKLSPNSVARKPVTGKELDRDNRSVNESNSTDPKSENVENGAVKVENEPEPARGVYEKTKPASGSGKPVREESCNDSSDSIAKGMVRVRVKVEEEGGAGDSPESWESVAESKGSGEKESSDVQSSASKLRKKESDMLHCGSSGGDERENENQSPTMKGASVESQPLVDFLDILRSHKLGSVFERLLESQETSKYRNPIRQHIDLETVKRKVEEGWYLDCDHKFFRDLLLLVNNVIIIFGKKSKESIAAIELRQLISKKMAQRNAKADLSDEKQISLLPISLPSKQSLEPSDSLLRKPEIAGIITVCRKRSSITAKGSASSSGSDRKREQTAALAEDKPVLEFKQITKSSVIAEEHRITKKRTRDRSASSPRSSKKNGKNLAITNYDKNSVAISNQNQGNVGSPTEHSQPKSEKKKNPITAEVKKQSAANFLDRMKRNSSLNNGSLLDSLKSSMLSGKKDSKGITEQKRSGSSKGDDRKDKVTRRSSGGRQSKDEGSPSKKNVGRPPKRAAAPSPLLAGCGKRSRAVGDTDALASKQPSRKRSRK